MVGNVEEDTDQSGGLDMATVRDTLLQLNVQRFQELDALVCWLKLGPPQRPESLVHQAKLAADIGMASGTLVLHAEATLADIVSRGAVWCCEEHPHDMRAVYRKYSQA